MKRDEGKNISPGHHQSLIQQTTRYAITSLSDYLAASDMAYRQINGVFHLEYFQSNHQTQKLFTPRGSFVDCGLSSFIVCEEIDHCVG